MRGSRLPTDARQSNSRIAAIYVFPDRLGLAQSRVRCPGRTLSLRQIRTLAGQAASHTYAIFRFAAYTDGASTEPQASNAVLPYCVAT
jgi:hypothetical protein